MNRILLITVLVFACSFPSGKLHAQATRSAYTDATILSDAVIRKDFQQLGYVLGYYFNHGELMDLIQLDSLFTKNPFLKNIPPDFLKDIPKGGPTNTGFAESGPIPTLIGNQTFGIDAAGTFIAKRFKEEINIAFLDHFRKDLENIPVLADLLPLTKRVLVNGDPYNYPSFMETLKEAFETDLRNITQGMTNAISNGDVVIGDSTLKWQTLVLLHFSTYVMQNTNNPLSAFNLLANDPILKKLDSNARNGIYTIVLLVNTLKVTDDNKLFLGAKEINTILTDNNIKNFYLALLLKQNEAYIQALLPQSDPTILLNHISKLYPIVDKLNVEFRALKIKISTGQMNAETLLNSYEIIIASTKQLLDFAKNDLQIKYDPKLDLAIGKLDTVGIIAGNLQEKKYGIAVLNVIDLVKNGMDPKKSGKMVVYLTFASNILKAENSQDMENALETAALPVGSYRIKRNTSFNVSLNAYGGGFYGVKSNASEKIFGFTAPIGIYFGWGNLRKTEKADNGKSIGLFFSVVDVGAVASFRLRDNKTELAKSSWSNVIAPGIFTSFGFGKCPVSLNLGIQYGPELNSIDNTGNPVFVDKAWFIRGGLVIDIPVFNFYSKR